MSHDTEVHHDRPAPKPQSPIPVSFTVTNDWPAELPIDPREVSLLLRFIGDVIPTPANDNEARRGQ
jgi:hypothetical protein